ncbi:hypothetical protein LJR244_004217 [Brucella pseudogrignonensis]
MGRSDWYEAFLDRLQHRVAHVRDKDVSIGDRNGGDDLALKATMMEVRRMSSQFQQVSGPSEQLAYDHAFAIVGPSSENSRMVHQNCRTVAHCAMNPLGVDGVGHDVPADISKTLLFDRRWNTQTDRLFRD